MRKCKNCGSKFSPDDGFLRRRFKKKHIVGAVSFYQSGLSLSKVKDHMWQHHGVKVSRWMILLWCRHFTKVISNFTETLKPEIKGNVHADEVIVKSKGKKNYYWGAKDRKTKFKIAGILTKRRTLSGAIYVFEKIRNGCIGIPEKIITDKLAHYRRARGFKNTESGEDLLKLMDNCYNFVHPHMGLNGRTPAEEANIVLKLGRNKLLNLIKFFHEFEMEYSGSMNAENNGYTMLSSYN